MALDTLRLALMPCWPEHLLSLMHQPQRFAELTGFPAAEGLRGFFVSEQVSADWVEQLQNASGPDPWRYGFFVVDRENRAVIGSAGFKGPPDGAGVVEIAYGIVPTSEGRGFATEAAAALVGLAFASEHVRLVCAHTLPTANASTRVLEKCGFKHVGSVIDPDDGLVWRWERRRESLS